MPDYITAPRGWRKFAYFNNFPLHYALQTADLLRFVFAHRAGQVG